MSLGIGEGALALARNRILLALSCLGGMRARAAETAFGDGEWQDYIAGIFGEQERLLLEALDALSGATDEQGN